MCEACGTLLTPADNGKQGRGAAAQAGQVRPRVVARVVECLSAALCIEREFVHTVVEREFGGGQCQAAGQPC